MKINDPLPTFELKGTDGQMHHSAEANGKKATVVIFTCNHCPYARAYVNRIAQIADEYTPKGVAFFAINSNDPQRYPQDSFDNMIPMGHELHLHGRYLFDETQNIARAFGAERTPEVFAFDANHRLVYHGAIDDNWEHPKKVTLHYLKEALDALLSGKEVPRSDTQQVGCTVKWKTPVH